MISSVKVDITSKDVSEATGAMISDGSRELRFTGISTDSRGTMSGELFFALLGDKFDGHGFVPDAINKGATGVVINRGREVRVPSGTVVFEVDDTLFALGDIASRHREKLNIKVVGITGSNGKTTTKEITFLVSKEKYRTKKSEGNFNNLIGLPLTLLSAKPEDDVLILEMGMNVVGEIKRLSEIARPDIGVITNIGPVHLEGVGDIDGVLREKSELLISLPKGAMAIINLDCDYSKSLIGKIKANLLTFSIERKADVTAKDISDLGWDGTRANFRLPSGEFSAHLKIPGIKNLQNALAAACVGEALGVPTEGIKNAIESARSIELRMEQKTTDDGIVILNDSYNANPVSLEAALDFFKKNAGDRDVRLIAVMGDMLELGSYTKKGHESVGRAASRLGYDFLFLLGNNTEDVASGALGEGMKKENIFTYPPGGHKDLIRDLKDILKPKDRVLIKGSRGMRMEKITSGIINKEKEG